MDEKGADDPRTVEAVFQDFKGRRTALIKALTTDVKEFFEHCDPEKDNLCLYGYPNEQWEVRLPSEVAFLPEPAIGINFARDETPRTHWLYLIAFHCDSWLISLAFFRGARYKFCKDDRERLFTMINDLPSVSEVVINSEGSSKAEDEHGESLCGACGVGEGSNEFWILCDTCEKWFHGKCVKVTPAMAKHIQEYECPSCSKKKAQP